MKHNLGPLCKLRKWVLPDIINWDWLSRNPNAIPILEQNLDKIDWYYLSANPNAIYLLEQNPDKIYWTRLSANPNAIHLLEQNPDKIHWLWLSLNPFIFEYDYKAMKERMNIIAEELIANRFHPRNFDKFVSWGFEDFELN